MLGGLKRVILWDYPRASWQYDLMVAGLLAFVFLTPREWFHDRPRIPNTKEIAMIPNARGAIVFWVEPQLVDAIPASMPESQRMAKLGEILSSRTGKRQAVARIEPIMDSEKEIKGYMAIMRP